MLAPDDRPDNLPDARWVAPPWDRHSPAWLDIDGRLPPEHPARLVDRLLTGLDLSELRRSYAGRGSPAHPPELLLRLVLFELLQGHPSPAQWQRHSAELDPAKWLLLGLRPGRSCLYQFRDRCGPLIDGLNRQLLEAARAEGHLAAGCLALDGTLVAALGSRHRLVTAKALSRRLQRLDAPPPAPRTPQASPRRPEPTPRGRSARLRARLRDRSALERLECRARRARETRSRTARRKRRDVERLVICPSEPEAALGRDKLKTFRPLYNVQLARTTEGVGLIAGYDVVAAGNDIGQLGPLLRRTEALLGRRPEAVLVDAHYAGPADLASAEALGVTVYSPVGPSEDPPEAAAGRAGGPITKADFRWLAREQTYRCPRGHLLVRVRQGTEPRQGGVSVRLVQYRCPPAHCRACPLQERCTRAPGRGRLVKRNEHDELVEALRRRMRQPEARALYGKRCQTVELSYAELKEHRGLRRFHGFGLRRARAQVGLLVLAVNGMALQKARLAGPRAAPSVSAA